MTDINEPPSVGNELAQHSASLRRLAQDLVGGIDAEDLVQDTAVRALQARPTTAGGLFGWLATVMRNLAANGRRGRQRRERREAAGSGSSGAPSASELAIQRDSVRAVTEALWSLPEPYQGTLMMRYFQDQSPAQIAARTGTPLPTVKSRLQRGLDMLRAQMARRDGRDWRAALLPAFGLAAPGPWLLPISVVSMSMLGKSVAACAVVSMVAWSWWSWSGPEVAPVAPHASPAPADPTLPATTGGIEDAAAREVVASSGGAPVSPATELPFLFRLRCFVADPEGLPVAGVQIAFAPPQCSLALWSQATDEHGLVTLHWHGRVREMMMAVGVAAGSRSSLQQVRLTAGQEGNLGFVVGTAPPPFQVRVNERGEQVVDVPECSKAPVDCRQCHAPTNGPDVFEVRGSFAAGLQPFAQFGERCLLPEAPPTGAGTSLQIDEFATTSLFLAHSEYRPKPAGHVIGATLEGTVFGADGQPVQGVRVSVQRVPDRGFTHLVRTVLDGRFEVRDLGVGTYEVRAGGGAEGFVTRMVEVTANSPMRQDLMLATGRTLRGSAADAKGSPLAGARVEYQAADGTVSDFAEVGPAGQFAFANLPAGFGRLLLWGVRGEKLPIAEETNVLPESGLVRFDLAKRGAPLGSVQLVVHHADGAVAEDLEARLWQVQTGRGAAFEKRADGRWHVSGLASGFYRVEVGTPGSGFLELGQHWIDGLGVADLGTITLPAPGHLRLEAEGELEALELCRIRDDLDVRADGVQPASRSFQLPVGRWRATWRRAGVVASCEFALMQGGETVEQLSR